MGRNYESHAKEMSSILWPATSPDKKPILFIKPSTTYLRPGSTILLPPGAEVEHEVELGVIISKDARNVSKEQAWDYIYGYCCSIDLTARNWQKNAKKKGQPWAIGKCLDGFLQLSDVVEREKIEEDGKVGRERITKEIWLEVDGKVRQRERMDRMIWPVDELLSFVSKRFTLQRGDLLITGTPSGVGPLLPGNKVKAGIADVVSMEFACEENKEWLD